MGTVSKNFTMHPTTSESDLPPRTESLQICAQFAINTVVKYFLNNYAAHNINSKSVFDSLLYERMIAVHHVNNCCKSSLLSVAKENSLHTSVALLTHFAEKKCSTNHNFVLHPQNCSWTECNRKHLTTLHRTCV